MVLSNPVGELGGGPGALSLGELGAHGIEDGRREGGVLAAARFVDQGIKAAVKEGFEPGADGLFMLAEMPSDARGIPTSISQTEHLQAIVNSLLAADAIRRSTSYVVLSRPIRPRVQPLVDAVGASSSG